MGFYFQIFVFRFLFNFLTFTIFSLGTEMSINKHVLLLLSFIEISIVSQFALMLKLENYVISTFITNHDGDFAIFHLQKYFVRL